MTDLTKLAEKVEALSGPCRETDELVYVMAYIPPERLGRLDRGGGTGVVGWWLNDGPYETAIDVPRYTASVDAVLALIAEKLPGWGWKTLQPVPGWKPFGEIWSPSGHFCGEAATPALALLAAFLRAMENNNG